jgi:hypothetical protein
LGRQPRDAADSSKYAIARALFEFGDRTNPITERIFVEQTDHDDLDAAQLLSQIDPLPERFTIKLNRALTSPASQSDANAFIYRSLICKAIKNTRNVTKADPSCLAPTPPPPPTP